MSVEITFINSETEESYSDWEPMIMSDEEFEKINKAAELKGVSFEEFIQLALENMIEQYTDNDEKIS